MQEHGSIVNIQDAGGTFIPYPSVKPNKIVLYLHSN